MAGAVKIRSRAEGSCRVVRNHGSCREDEHNLGMLRRPRIVATVGPGQKKQAQMFIFSNVFDFSG